MNFFLGCFGAKDKVDFQPKYNSFAALIVPSTNKEAKISRNQLSDLFLSQELEDIRCDENNAKREPVDIHIQCCKNKITNSVTDLNNQLDRPSTSPIKPGDLETSLETREETPTSCGSVPSSASKNSGRTNAKCGKENFSPAPKNKSKPASYRNDTPVNGSKSSLLKSIPHYKAGNKVNVTTANGRTCRSPRDSRKPILRTVTAQCNGIPNSTNKYREDQIVNWDGTPFEERLEKALSEANSISQSSKILDCEKFGKLITKSGAYDTFEDEIDTAASQLQSLPHQKSLVSF